MCNGGTERVHAFDRLDLRPHACICSGGACAGSEHPTPRSPRCVATRSSRPSLRRPTTHRMDRVRPIVADRPGKALTGHDVQELPSAAYRRAPLARRAGGRCASPAATPGQRRAHVLRHERLPDDPPLRPQHGRRGLPDLRLRAPARLTDRRQPAARGRSCDTRPATCQRLPRNTRRTSPRRDRGRIVDNTVAPPEFRGQNPLRTPTSRAIIRSARRGRDERTAVPPQGGRAPRKGSRILRQEGRPFRKGGGVVRRLHRCRKAPDLLARVGGAPQGAPQLPARVASPPQGGRGDRVGGPFGRFAARRPSRAPAGIMSGTAGTPPRGCRLDCDVPTRHRRARSRRRGARVRRAPARAHSAR